MPCSCCCGLFCRVALEIDMCAIRKAAESEFLVFELGMLMNVLNVSMQKGDSFKHGLKVPVLEGKNSHFHENEQHLALKCLQKSSVKLAMSFAVFLGSASRAEFLRCSDSRFSATTSRLGKVIHFWCSNVVFAGRLIQRSNRSVTPIGGGSRPFWQYRKLTSIKTCKSWGGQRKWRIWWSRSE